MNTKNLKKRPCQIIGPTMIEKTRQEYCNAWDRNWPHSNAYMAELVIEVKASLGLAPNSKERPKEVRDEVLTMMRLDDHFQI